LLEWSKFTNTFPVVAPLGTSTTIDVLLQLEMAVAKVPLKVTVPWYGSKFVPVIVTQLPTPPKAGEMVVIVGLGT
jgi:hypothetical protein